MDNQKFVHDWKLIPELTRQSRYSQSGQEIVNIISNWKKIIYIGWKKQKAQQLYKKKKKHGIKLVIFSDRK